MAPCNLLTVHLLEAVALFPLLPARKQPGLTQTCLGSGGSFVPRVSGGCAAFCAQGQPGQGWTLCF